MALASAVVLGGGAVIGFAEASARGYDRSVSSSAITPAERAVTGGVARLRAPRSRMIRVPTSTFSMGSTPMEVVHAVARCAREPLGARCVASLFSDEVPAHRVTLSSYWLDRTEVTVRDYRRCVALRRCRPLPFAEGAQRFDQPRFPVSMVRFQDASAYCRFRGGRLPTEAEFERAARGARGFRYPWGNLYNSRASNHGRLGVDSTDRRDGHREHAPVGSYPAGKTREGFLDLAGNVAEWVSDRHANYEPVAVTDPTGPQSPSAGSRRVVRGGHYESAAPWLRAAARNPHEPPALPGQMGLRLRGIDPTTRAPFIGFRCARTARSKPASRRQ